MTRQRSIGISAGLVAANIVLMAVVATSPLAGLAAALFDTLILGVIVFGAVLSGGVYLARRGTRQENTGMAVAGVALLQGGYGVFGGMVLAIVPPGGRLTVALIAAVVSGAAAAVAAWYAFRTSRDLRVFRRYATYCFLGVLGVALVGTFSAPFAIVAFVLALTGFLCYLLAELGELKKRPDRTWLNAIGIYTAFMGVFIHVLQIVARLYADR